ncbi:DUF445 family protein [Anaerosalibacter massiliensis]|uniref:DUF445 family protein n=1 Tax=Anaerosalibacter massiliensis TaxID=1347392 RepID=UPI0005B2EB48|nr:DUF445 family protein [Anaerosalibacter massiliensis]
MRFIIPILVGAIIGYITNWLAIKMLFRPYEEKKILGLHIPFTPGLIPKEKSRIAKSVGDTIGVYLLSPEIVTEAIYSDKINNQLREWVEHNINKFKETNKSIKDFTMNIGNGNYYKSLNIIEEKLANFICSQFKKQKFKDEILNLVEDKVLNSPMDDFYKVIDERLELFIYELSVSEEVKITFKNLIDKKIDELANDERTLNEIIPEDFINILKKHINENREDIINELRGIFEEPSVNMRIKESITEFVSQNVSRAITIFMRPELISDKIFNEIEKYIYNRENDENIILVIMASIDKLLDWKAANIFSDISSKIDDEDMLNISSTLLSPISKKENQAKILDIVERKIKYSEADIKESLLNLISNKIEVISNSEVLYEKTLSIVHDIFQMIINKPVSCIFENVDKSTVTSIANFSKVIFDNFVKSKLPYIVELLNISKVVEDEINKFDVAFAEKIIIEIANKELKAITWLGALLGGIMGMLSPLLQLI